MSAALAGRSFSLPHSVCSCYVVLSVATLSYGVLCSDNCVVAMCVCVCASACMQAMFAPDACEDFYLRYGMVMQYGRVANMFHIRWLVYCTLAVCCATC